MKRIALAVLLLAAGGAAGFWGGRAYEAGRASTIGPEAIAAAEHLSGLRFTGPQRALMAEDLRDQEAAYRKLRDVPIANSVPPVLVFNPLPDGSHPPADAQRPMVLSPPGRTAAPERLEDLAYYTVRELGELLRTRRITSETLTRLALARLKKYDPQLHCVITLTEELALRQARRADAEIAAGQYRGPLHGIPYGAKDLLAVQGYKTTWGSVPYKDQSIDDTATVIRKLEAAGAVLVAKTSVGELAWGDVWFGGTTRSPWNLKEGSSGSSAGSAAATSAGLVPFAIGTETWGSIVSPCTRCGVTGLRPTFGRVSRAGAMALSWSMDKIGPIARDAEDCAIVIEAIRGSDGRDAAAVDVPFNYAPRASLKGLRIGCWTRISTAITRLGPTMLPPWPSCASWGRTSCPSSCRITRPGPCPSS